MNQEGVCGGYAVRGVAIGLLGPVVLELRFGDDVELLVVTQDGPFVFETRLETGDSYALVLVYPGIPCTLRNQAGVVAGADTAIDLTCTDASSLASVVVSGIASPAITLVPGTTEYAVDLSLLQQSVTVAATVATPGDTLSIAGMPATSDVPTAEIPLSLGDNFVDIVVENGLGWQRTYRLILRRAAQLTPHVYGKASNTGADDLFGYSVVLSGDTLAVGAPHEASAATGVDGNQADNTAPDSGAVYVFRRTGSVWQQEAYLKASNTGIDDRFGTSLALSGEILVVGAHGEDSAATGVGGSQTDNSALSSGAVYVFRHTATAWQQEAYLKASNTGAEDGFGWNVALSGDTLAVGAYNEDSAATGVGGNQADNTAPDSGAVYVFRRTGSVWQQEAYLKASNTGVGDHFGESVTLSDDTLGVGAASEDSAATGVDGNQADNTALGSGAVYLFRRTGSVWQQEAYLKASNTGAGDEYGTSVALSGDTLAVGATGEDSAATGVNGSEADNTALYSGAAYVFRRMGTAWQQEAYLKASNTDADDWFGYSVALSGDTVLVGAPLEDSAATGVNGDQADNTTPSNGAVYVLRRAGTAWQQEAYLKASSTGNGDLFGTSMALSSDTLTVGARYESSAATGVNGDQANDAALHSGAIYIFY
jgi:hypothetical protein